MKAVETSTAAVINAQTGVEEEFLVITFSYGGCVESLAILGRIAQVKLLDSVIVKTALIEVAKAYVSTLLGVEKLVLKILRGKLVEHKHALTLGLGCFFLAREFLLMYLDVVFLGKITQSLGIRHLLMLHDKSHRATSLATPEAVAKLLGW